MAFTGVTVSCGFAVGDNSDNKSNQPIMAKAIWSEEPSAGVATTNAAPGDTKMVPIMRIYSGSEDIWVAVGPSPNPAASPRHLVPSMTVYDIYVDANDKLAYQVAS